MLHRITFTNHGKLVYVRLTAVFALFFCHAIWGGAQEKVALTKGETISYLNKVLQRAVDYECPRSGCSSAGQFATILSATFKDAGDAGVTFSYKTSERMLKPADCGVVGCCWEGYSNDLTFQPAFISSITLSTDALDKRGPLNTCVIAFKSKDMVKKSAMSFKGKPFNRTLDIVRFYFVLNDPSDFDKVRKAFTHLKALYAAEDDPFGE